MQGSWPDSPVLLCPGDFKLEHGKYIPFLVYYMHEKKGLFWETQNFSLRAGGLLSQYRLRGTQRARMCSTAQM